MTSLKVLKLMTLRTNQLKLHLPPTVKCQHLNKKKILFKKTNLVAKNPKIAHRVTQISASINNQTNNKYLR